jgi:hypothetical protein
LLAKPNPIPTEYRDHGGITSAPTAIAAIATMTTLLAVQLSASIEKRGVGSWIPGESRYIRFFFTEARETLPKITIGLVRAGMGAPSPAGPRAGGGREEAGLHV